MTDGEIVINRPMLDWLTVTTFDGSLFRSIVRQALGTVSQSPAPSRRMQYKGFSSGSLFYGQGEQEGREHFMIICSGSASDGQAKAMIGDAAVTRIDLQVTIERPDWYKHRSLVETLRHGEWPGRRRTIPLHEDGKGGSTVYIGGKSSDKLIRIYIKNTYYLRYEIQLRRLYAQRAADAVRDAGKTAVSAILSAELTKLPRHPILDEFARFLSGYQEVAAYKANPSMVARMRWLSSLLNTMQEMANDHDYGDTVCQWLQDIVIDARRNKV